MTGEIRQNMAKKILPLPNSNNYDKLQKTKTTKPRTRDHLENLDGELYRSSVLLRRRRCFLSRMFCCN